MPSGVPAGVERALQGVGAKPEALEKYDAVSAFAIRSIMWSWYDGRSTWGSADGASTPFSPKRRLRDPAEAREDSTASDGARMWIGSAHRSSETCPSGFLRVSAELRNRGSLT